MPSIFIKSPEAVLDYQWDWSSWLDDGETIASYTVSSESDITIDSDNEADGVVTAWLSGGTVGMDALLVCHITTDVAREDSRIVVIMVRQR